MGACVVGGGIAGTLTAYELYLRGLDVRVLDAGEPGAATPASAGVVFPLSEQARDEDAAPLAHHGHVVYFELCLDIETEVGHERRGLLCVGPEAPQVADWAREQKQSCETLSPGECARRFPLLTPPDRDAALLPDVAQFDPRRFQEVYRQALQNNGVAWEEARVLQVLVEQDRVVGVSDGAREWQADRVVIAAGAWSSQIRIGSETYPPARPRRGQLVAWRSVAASGLPVVLDGDRYLVARQDGTVLAGATDEDAGFDAGVTDQARDELTRFARRWCPELLAGEPDEQWVGLRPQGDEGIPRGGAHEEIEGLYFNTGHHLKGFVGAPAMAELVGICLRNPGSLE